MVSPTVITPVTPGIAGAQVVARDFTERFGTWSTDTPYDNFSDIKEISTAAFYSSLKKTAETANEYRGETTRVLSQTIKSGSETTGLIVFEISAQKEAFAVDRSAPKIEYKKASVTVEKQNNLWKVSAFSWL